jgi:SAM-dependent methyltransferase
VDTDDVKARQALLEGWTADQHRSHLPPGSPSRTRRGMRMAVRYYLVGHSQRLADRVFDRGLGTSGGMTEPEHEHPDRVQYVPSGWHILPRALRFTGVSDRDVFVDFGCGKGRVLHQAAKRPFRRVVGVEVSPVLAEMARHTLAARSRRHRCRNVEIVVCDVADYRIPDDLTIGYLYHPFTQDTFRAVLAAIVDSIERRPRRVRLIYYLPVLKDEILATERFRLLTEQQSKLLDSPWAQVAILESL